MTEQPEPQYGTIELKGDNKSWVVEVPLQQAYDMQRDGFDVQLIWASIPFEGRLQ